MVVCMLPSPLVLGKVRICDARILLPLLSRNTNKMQLCPPSFGNDRSPYGRMNQRLQIEFRAPDDERCAARNTFSL